MKFVKTLQCTYYEIHHGVYETEIGKEKGVTKDCKGLLIAENYRNVHIGHGCCISWENPHGQNPSLVSTAIQECQPSNAFHPATTEECHLRHMYIGCPHDFSVMTKVENLSRVSM
jgi:hypothetical protein